MSPARALPAVETVPEARDAGPAAIGEQQELKLESAQDRRVPEDTISENSWLSSIKDDYPARRHQTGSPQLHPLLKARPRSRDRRRSSGIPVARPDYTHRRASADYAWHGLEEEQVGSSGSDLDPRSSASRSPTRQQKRARLSFHSAYSGSMLPAARTNVQGDSSSDDPTPKNTSLAGMTPEPQLEATQQDDASKVGGPSVPDFLGYLDKDAPAVPVDGTEQSIADAASWNATTTNGKASPSAQSSSSSSTTGSPYSDQSSERTTDTERSSSPERSVDGDETPVAPVLNFVETSLHAASKRRSSLFDVDRYGTPEMPRGTANLPHIPVSVLTPRVPNQGHPKHLPRAEKLPLSGYELLASRISSSSSSTSPGARSHPGSDSSSSTATPREHIPRRHSSASNIYYRSSFLESEPTIQPIYRRFKAMNHRLLLHLQDELSELEEQLHRLDTTDTQTRRLQNRILPASRRAEALAGGELQSHKTDILAKIGFKLGQYNHALSSFTTTRDIPSPSPSDVNEYRRYLATHQPVTEVEARFLDSIDDLVTLAPPNSSPSPPSSSSPSRAPSPSAAAAASAGTTTTTAAAARARDQQYYQALKTTAHDAAESSSSGPEPASPIPIPGTMHGNSWRNGRGHLRGSSSISHSPSPGLAPLPPTPRLPSSMSRPRSSSEAAFMTSRVGTPRLGTPRTGTPSVGGGGGVGNLDDVATAPLPTIKVDPVVKLAQGSREGRAAAAASADLSVVHVAIALAVAVLLPILAFSIIPGFVGRLIVVFLVGMSVVGSVVQSGSVGAGGGAAAGSSSKDLFLSVAIYTGVMAVVAGVLQG
ncbi:hypothetical protein Daus18300_014388 [Diaporthe australafricana]|uniref:DUF6594 domain-containing protein n=1 Tax=Diaporthe australafricana TaxID=127596 RepID=A0ABR3VVD5_9PEZI